jgi:phosphatidylglycerol lysyltransferase
MSVGRVIVVQEPAGRGQALDIVAEVAAALLAFRGIYFVLPLFAAATRIGLREFRRRLPWLRGFFDHPKHWIGAVVPQILAAAIFVSGAVLLFSGALPAAAGRLASLHEYLPLPVIETSHFIASLTGAALLLLARAVQRRVDAAYVTVLALLAAGSALSLAKGWDYEEAIVLGAIFLLLLPLRGYFYREASFLGERFSGGWIVSIAVVLLGSAWLGVFAYTHPDYSATPWWRFALDAEASRSLRATVGATSLAVLFGMARLLRPARPVLSLPSAADLDRARPIIERSLRTYPNLVFRRDKALLFSRSGNALLMYGRMRRSWIAMGDPVGPENEARELLWQFHDACDRFDGWSVFFEVQPEHLDWYADLGLTLTTLGEEARVDLPRFDLDAPEHARLRQARAKLARIGCRFEILPREAVPAALPALARVSEAWLSGKATREKGFSNASFDEQYLAHSPVAVVRKNEDIIAFANLWMGAGKEELSVDLMRHVPEAPNGTMDFLFSDLLGWGREQGYRWFNLGTAPLSGLSARPGPPLWRHLGTFVYQHGEHFYNFRGLRAYKEKFHPVWTPLYLASPGGVALPAILVDVTALIAGGFMGVFSKQAVKAKRGS